MGRSATARPLGSTSEARGRRLGRRLVASLTSEGTPATNNGGMVALALILLVLVAVLVVAIVVSNPEIYDLSIFGAVIPVNSCGHLYHRCRRHGGHDPGTAAAAQRYPSRARRGASRLKALRSLERQAAGLEG